MMHRDLAIVLDESISAEMIQACIAEQAGEYLQDLCVFDVYQGKGIPAGKKSIALGLTFQHSSRTLRDEEIHEIIQGVVAKLQQKLDATLRV